MCVMDLYIYGIGMRTELSFYRMTKGIMAVGYIRLNVR